MVGGAATEGMGNANRAETGIATVGGAATEGKACRAETGIATVSGATDDGRAPSGLKAGMASVGAPSLDPWTTSTSKSEKSRSMSSMTTMSMASVGNDGGGATPGGSGG